MENPISFFSVCGHSSSLRVQGLGLCRHGSDLSRRLSVILARSLARSIPVSVARPEIFSTPVLRGFARTTRMPENFPQHVPVVFFAPVVRHFVSPPGRGFVPPAVRGFVSRPDPAGSFATPSAAYISPPVGYTSSLPRFVSPTTRCFVSPPVRGFVSPAGPARSFATPPVRFVSPPLRVFVSAPDKSFVAPPVRDFVYSTVGNFDTPPVMDFDSSPVGYVSLPPRFVSPPASCFVSPPVWGVVPVPGSCFATCQRFCFATCQFLIWVCQLSVNCGPISSTSCVSRATVLGLVI